MAKKTTKTTSKRKKKKSTKAPRAKPVSVGITGGVKISGAEASKIAASLPHPMPTWPGDPRKMAPKGMQESDFKDKKKRKKK